MPMLYLGTMIDTHAMGKRAIESLAVEWLTDQILNQTLYKLIRNQLQIQTDSTAHDPSVSRPKILMALIQSIWLISIR